MTMPKAAVFIGQCTPRIDTTLTSFLSPPQPQLALTAGQDGSSQLWQLRDSSNATESSGDAATLVAVCRAHTDTVAALAAAPAGDHFASAGWDGTVHIWRTGAGSRSCCRVLLIF